MKSSLWKSSLFLFVVSSSWLAIRVGPMPLGDFFLVTTVLGSLFFGRSSGEERQRSGFMFSIPFALLALALVAIRGLLVPAATLSQLTNELWSVGSMLLLVPVVFLSQGERSYRFGEVFVFGVVVSSAVACLEVLTGFRVVDLIGSQGTYRGRVSGLTGHPNQLGLSIVLALAVWQQGWSGASFGESLLRKYRWPAISLLLVGLGLSASRSAALAAACLGAIQLSQLLRDPKRSASKGAISCGALFVVSWVVFPRASIPLAARLLGNSETASSDDLRRGQLEYGMDLFWEAPFIGSGVEAAGSIHNFLLNVFTSWGAIGALAFLLAVVSTLRNGSLWNVCSNRALLAWMVFGFAQNAITDRFIFLSCVLAMFLQEAVKTADLRLVDSSSKGSCVAEHGRTNERDYKIENPNDFGLRQSKARLGPHRTPS